ncbi:MAG: aspartate aminotransferase family protein [Candidatus Omnitrophica bacterium]|nr:aspartate aminotransferase family protein [Candidatus Omnitrophota bacterium]MBU4457721.1 aspartate aminotransferase family protein [Candidatus Omnitrophota bacterium]
MNTKEIISQYDKFVIGTYTRIPAVIVKGKGLKVWDLDGNEYLDFFPGWAVSGLGHCHPMVVGAVRNYLKKIIHVPNNYYNMLQGKLAQEIIEHSFEGKVFFCNSGAEANEGAFKLVRAYGVPKGRYEVITMQNSFHGRTLATITATGQPKYQKGFEPLPQGFKSVAFNDISALENAITDKTAAIMLELIQGEGGINVADKDYVSKVRKICDDKGLILILDEVQTGIGRTGKMFCFEHYGITPDVMTLAKSLGGGLPIGAMVASKRFQDVLKPGMHASTFGGSPIACSAALAVFEAIKKEGLLRNTQEMGDYLRQKLDELKKKKSIIKEIRGKGLMIGAELSIEGKDIVEGCFKNKLLINCAHGTVLRLMPGMIVTKKQIDSAIGILDKVMQ